MVWPFKDLQPDDAWAFATAPVDGYFVLLDLSKLARLELAGLSAWGGTSDQVEELMPTHVEPITMGRYLPRFDQENVLSALRRLDVPRPRQDDRA